MKNKVLLILADGMRPDSLAACGHPFIAPLLAASRWSLNAQSVIPPVTLPCHMSLFHSVRPDRHGVLTNTFTPMARPVRGLFDVLHAAGRFCAFYYDWPQLRDLGQPGSVDEAYLMSGSSQGYGITMPHTVRRCKEALARETPPDFIFLYLGLTDEAGHKHGWMNAPYLDAVHQAWDAIADVLSVLPEDYTVLITADHGGHDRNHGVDIPEDMNIPCILYGPGIAPGAMDDPVSLLDFAPTIAHLLNVPPDPDWEGHVLLP